MTKIQEASWIGVRVVSTLTVGADTEERGYHSAKKIQETPCIRVRVVSTLTVSVRTPDGRSGIGKVLMYSGFNT